MLYRIGRALLFSTVRCLYIGAGSGAASSARRAREDRRRKGQVEPPPATWGRQHPTCPVTFQVPPPLSPYLSAVQPPSPTGRPHGISSSPPQSSPAKAKKVRAQAERATPPPLPRAGRSRAMCLAVCGPPTATRPRAERQCERWGAPPPSSGPTCPHGPPAATTCRPPAGSAASAPLAVRGARAVEAAVASLGRGDVRRAAGERETYRAAATGCAVGPAGQTAGSGTGDTAGVSRAGRGWAWRGSLFGKSGGRGWPGLRRPRSSSRGGDW